MLLDPRHYRIDEILRRPYTPETPFGSSGDCMWATSPQGWGFSGGVHWVHKTGDSGLAPIQLQIWADGGAVVPGDAVYRPSHVTLHARDEVTGLQATEDKFITRDDVCVSVLSLRNAGEDSVDVRLDLTWGVPPGENRFRGDIPVFVHREGPPGDDLRGRIPPGYRAVLVFVVAFAPDQAEAVRRAARWARDPDPVRVHAQEYQAWFDENVPRFDCSDPWATKMWYHRWYVVRKNHGNPGVGLTREDTFSEGRWNVDWYTASITYGAGHVLRETRWLRDARYCQNYFRGFARNQRSDGLFRSWYVNGIARPNADEGKYTEWIGAAVWDMFLVHPDRAFLQEAEPALQRNADYWTEHMTGDDGLLTVDNHWWTGMEWQPSFFYRADYRLGERRDGCDVQNPVKRLDLTAYYFAGLRALAQIAGVLGDEESADVWRRYADVVKAAVLYRMWDDADGFFYDVLPETHEKIRTAPTIAAFYPFYAHLPGSGQIKAWAKLIDPAWFWTTHPPASTAQTSPAFSQEPEMRGKPLTACYWNGPTWPHANSLVISGLANSLRTHGEDAHAPFGVGRDTLFALFNSFCRAQFENGDFERPHTGESYRGDTGAWQTPERDYHHSTWADLVITALIGLVPRTDDVLEVSPLLPTRENGGWSHFCLENVPYHGRLLTLVWDDPREPGDAYNDGDKGFTVYVDGARFHHQSDLTPFALPLPS